MVSLFINEETAVKRSDFVWTRKLVNRGPKIEIPWCLIPKSILYTISCCFLRHQARCYHVMLVYPCKWQNLTVCEGSCLEVNYTWKGRITEDFYQFIIGVGRNDSSILYSYFNFTLQYFKYFSVTSCSILTSSTHTEYWKRFLTQLSVRTNWSFTIFLWRTICACIFKSISTINISLDVV